MHALVLCAARDALSAFRCECDLGSDYAISSRTGRGGPRAHIYAVSGVFVASRDALAPFVLACVRAYVLPLVSCRVGRLPADCARFLDGSRRRVATLSCAHPSRVSLHQWKCLRRFRLVLSVSVQRSMMSAFGAGT